MITRCLNAALNLVCATLVVALLAASPAQGGLVQYMKLDGNGTAAVGTSGTAAGVGGAPSAAADRNGTASGAVQFTVSAVNTNQASEDGNYYSVAGGGGLNNANTGTISIWANWSGTQDNRFTPSYGAILARQSNLVFSDNVLALSTNVNATRKVEFAPGPAATATGDYVTGTTSIADNTWHHIAISFAANGVSNADYRLYVDGVQEGSTTTDSRFSNNNAIPLTLGAWIGNGDTYSTSKLDDFGVFSQALSLAEIKAVSSLGLAPSLKYDLDLASSLFDLHTATTGSVVIGSLTWNYGTGMSTGLGQVTQVGSQYFLQLTAGGTGVFTVLAPVPEPASGLALCIFGAGVQIRRKRAARQG